MSVTGLSTVQLRCFVRIVETGSFVEAGRALGLTASAISKIMSRLEEATGVRLLNRSTHSLSLTPEGEELIGPAREAVRHIDAADTTLAAALRDGVRGRVRISAPTAFLRTCLAPLLPAFQARHPDIMLDLRGSDVMVDLADTGADIALRSGPVTGIPGHLCRTLCSFAWVVCASPAYLERRGEPLVPADLAGHALIGFRNHRTGIVDPWRLGGGRSGHPEMKWTPNPTTILDDANALAAAVAAGAGLAWTPRWLVALELRSNGVVPVLADYAGEPSPLSIIRRNDAQRPKRTEDVIAFLAEHAEQFS